MSLVESKSTVMNLTKWKRERALTNVLYGLVTEMPNGFFSDKVSLAFCMLN